MQHEAKITRGLNWRDGETVKQWAATCSCGWDSRVWHDKAADARKDAKQHAEER